MANIQLTTFEEIAPRIGRNGTKKVGNNTVARLSADASLITVALHGNDIVRLHAGGAIEVNMCGWHTLTTRDRLSQFIPGANVSADGVGQSAMWKRDYSVDPPLQLKRELAYSSWELVYTPGTGPIF